MNYILITLAFAMQDFGTWLDRQGWSLECRIYRFVLRDYSKGED